MPGTHGSTRRGTRRRPVSVRPPRASGEWARYVSGRPACSSREALQAEEGDRMAVRLNMDKGASFVILASVDDVNRAFQAALASNEPLNVQTPAGLVAINPQRILYLEE